MFSILSPLPRSAAIGRARRKVVALALRLAPFGLAAWVAVSTGGGFPG